MIKITQGRRLIAHLRRKPHTYLEMLMLGVSVCPWRRVQECLQEGEHLYKRKNDRGLTTWFVTK